MAKAKPTSTLVLGLTLVAVGLFYLAIYHIEQDEQQWIAIGVGATLCFLCGEWSYKLRREFFND
jgi:hypothetical protein